MSQLTVRGYLPTLLQDTGRAPGPEPDSGPH